MQNFYSFVLFSRLKKMIFACASGVFLFFAHQASAQLAALSDMSEVYSSDVSQFKKWNGMRARFEEQQMLPADLCGKLRFHPCNLADWKKFIEGERGKQLAEQLHAVNDYGNAVPYVVDQINWSMEDYWETPVEFLNIAGDCEDYAITKYYTLRALGYAADRMRIMIVQDFNLGGVIHAILGVYAGDELYILDNQIAQVMPARKIYHYKPIYGINEQGWWAYYPK